MPREGTKKEASKRNVDIHEDKDSSTNRILASLSKKLDAMNESQERRHNELYTKLQHLELQTAQLTLKSLKDGVNFLEKEAKEKIERKAETSEVEALERCEDMQNRARRNNVVIWNVPEGSEKGASTEVC